MYLTGENIIINLDKVNSIVHDEETIMFKFAYRTEEVVYTPEDWQMIIDVLKKSEKDARFTLPKPLDVKVVNK